MRTLGQILWATSALCLAACLFVAAQSDWDRFSTPIVISGLLSTLVFAALAMLSLGMADLLDGLNEVRRNMAEPVLNDLRRRMAAPMVQPATQPTAPAKTTEKREAPSPDAPLGTWMRPEDFLPPDGPRQN